MSGLPLMRAHIRYRPIFLIQVSPRKWDERDRIERKIRIIPETTRIRTIARRKVDTLNSLRLRGSLR
jgi:hypothetical protein